MPNYVVLGNYTDKGVQAVKAAPDRMAGAAARVEAMGGKIESIHFTSACTTSWAYSSFLMTRLC